MPNVTFDTLIGGGASNITSTRVGNKVVQISDEQAKKILHISGFGLQFTELRLLELCSKLLINPIRVQFPTHNHGPLDGQPKGFAWIEFSSNQESQTALNSLNNYPIGPNKVLHAAFYSNENNASQVRGFAHLKKKNQEVYGSNQDGNYNQDDTIDGVPYKFFLNLCHKLDEGQEDDFEPIFDLPRLQLDKNGEMTLSDDLLHHRG
jgi:hypothetical protein